MSLTGLDSQRSATQPASAGAMTVGNLTNPEP